MEAYLDWLYLQLKKHQTAETDLIWRGDYKAERLAMAAGSRTGVLESGNKG